MTTPDDPSQQGQPPYPAPGGQPPQYPPLGGQPPQYPPPGPQPGQYPPLGQQPGQYPPLGQQPGQYPPPGGQPPQYPPAGPGQFPPPGGPGGVPAYAGVPGAYGAPPKRSRRKLLFIALGVIVVLIIAIVVVAVIATKDDITSIDDAKAGDCITISGTKNDATPKQSTCDSDSFTFIVSEQLDTTGGQCGGEQYSELTQKGKGKLCLVPNLRAGKCYEFPGTGGAITDFKNYECGKPAESPGRQVVKVANRVESTDVASCAEGAVPLTFDKPSPLGYCLELQTTQ